MGEKNGRRKEKRGRERKRKRKRNDGIEPSWKKRGDRIGKGERGSWKEDGGEERLVPKTRID